MKGLSSNAARNFVAGVLAAYGWLSFFCFLTLDQLWAWYAPRQPSPAIQAIYAHNQHGAISYFTPFQATACALVFWTSIPLFLLATALSPKKKRVSVPSPPAAVRLTWEADDPEKLLGKGAILGAALVPILVFVVGPYLVHALNGAGIVLALG